ncbi:TPA: hypothetical protein HA361_02165 [Candidatus Woesearchaeota archaeon]|nr:hypothetical protein [Candidatus Woesearchaeota archaeon]HII68574.1 hypothetical protein [Candidatus Woesearchaeota archaeon]
MPSRPTAILIGGLTAGILSIIPFIAFYNIFFGIWIVLGGLVAVFTYKRDAKEAVSLGQGAFLGFCAGIVGWLVVLAAILFTSGAILSVTLGLFIGIAISSVITLLVGIISLVAFITCATLGGILGAYMWGKENLKEEYHLDTNYVGKEKNTIEPVTKKGGRTK